MKRHALLIVNDTFPHSDGSLGSLSTVKDDLIGMQRVLNKLRLPPFTVVPPVVNGYAVDIDDKLEQILSSMDTEEDLLLVYYAGHGRILKTPGKNDTLLLATFGSRKRPDNRYLDFEYSKIEEKLLCHKVRRAVIVLDCCYSGAAFSEREVRGDSSSPNLPTPFSVEGYSQVQCGDQFGTPTSQKDMGDGIYIFTACAANEEAAGNTRTRNGVFTGHFVKALESARDESSDPITLQSVFQTVHKAMIGLPQTPSLIKVEGKTPYLVLAPRRFAGEKSKRSLEDWEPQSSERLSRLDGVSPMYLLDAGFRFLHWNAIFEDVIAKQLGLVIGCHALEFINGLGNDKSVTKRNPDVFPIPSDEEIALAESTGEIWEGYPTVDIERLDFVSDRFGLIVFNKLAIKIREPNCRKPTTWQIDLNARFVQHHKIFWKNAKEVVEHEALWATYAETYDAVVSKYPKYLNLIEKVVGQIGKCRDCLEIGAGTGNTTIALLADEHRMVTAIESNDAMLGQLSKKLADYNDRVTILKGDATTVLRRMYQEKVDDAAAPEIFEACVMTNVLFALADPADCLKALYRILKPGGILSISTPLSDAPVDALMNNIRDWHIKNKPDEWVAIDGTLWDSTIAINKKLSQLAADRKFDLAKIKQLLTDAQFQIDSDPVTGEYDGCVVLVKAIKPIRVADESPPLIIHDIETPGGKNSMVSKAAISNPVIEHPVRTKIKVFISYARKDSKKVEEFLAALEENIGPSRNYQYEIWKDDKNVVVGERWHDEIQRAVGDCDVGLLLVSPLFLTSEYIIKEELHRFMNEQPKPIIPVLLKDIDFILHDLKGIEHTQIFALYIDSIRKKSYVTCRGNRKGDFVRELFRQLEERITRLRLSHPIPGR